MINKDGGGTIFRFCRRGHRAHWGPPGPPTGENPAGMQRQKGSSVLKGHFNVYAYVALDMK